jgi:ABC-2 type transport system permease protein
MIGAIVFRETRGAFKTLIILCAFMIIYSAGSIAIYPAYRSMIGEQTAQGFAQNPYFQGLVGGRGSLLDVRGYISAELILFWTIVVGMFVAYMSVSFVAGDFENRYMDIVLSKPVSRRLYLIEKFIAMTIISMILSIITAFGMIAGLSGIGSLDQLSAQTALLTFIGVIPVLMVIAALSILVSVVFRKVRTGMGVGFAFVFAQIFMRLFGTFSKDLELLKTLSIFQYWDYVSVLFDNVFKVVDFIGLTILSFLILVGSIFVFERSDIPT